jgi:hypothetical protein
MPMALEIVSEYAKDIAPFLAAILNGIIAYESRLVLWRCLLAILTTVLFLAYGIANALGQ